MRELIFTIPEEQDGIAVRAFLRKHLKLSARVVSKQKFTFDGLLINGKHARVVDTLRAGDEFKICISDEKADYEASNLPLEILFEDEDFLIIDKPPGMPVHPSPGHDNDSLLNAVANYMEQSDKYFIFRPIYRLDKDTSGIIIIAKNRIAASGSELKKEYCAVVEGRTPMAGAVFAPISLEEGSRIKRSVGGNTEAETEFHRIAFDGRHSLVRLELHTGRTHQIRVHMAHIGHPIAGDDLYGGSKEHISRQALICKRVELSNTALSMNEAFEIEYPQDMKDAFGDLVE